MLSYGDIQTKSNLRNEILLCRDALHPEDRRTFSIVIAQNLEKSRLFDNLEPDMVVSAYWPIRSEVDPRTIFPLIREKRARIALPRIQGGAMHFHRWEDGDKLEKGDFGLLQPAADAPLLEPDILLTPLSVCDTSGGRIGYGKGYYDRSISRIESQKAVTVIGLAFSVQLVDHVPQESHDRKLDFLVTEKGCIAIKNNI